MLSRNFQYFGNFSCHQVFKAITLYLCLKGEGISTIGPVLYMFKAMGSTLKIKKFNKTWMLKF
jgi:hypothetical protein